jgi:S1-C subfamily serine protease
MKHAALLLLTVFASGCFSGYSISYRDSIVKEKAFSANHDAAVQLFSYDADGTRASVSGAVLSAKYGLILTVSHGVDLATARVELLPPPNGSFEEPLPVKLIAIDYKNDIAVFYVDPAKARFQNEVKLCMADGPDLESESVYLISYPFGFMKHAPTFGYVVGIFPREALGVKNHLAVNIWAQRGSSGGALYLTKDHSLIGLTRIIITGDATYPTMLFIPPENIREFLDKHNIPYNR